MGATVYVVIEGEYDDQRVAGVYANEKAAQDHVDIVDQLGRDSATWEAFRVDDEPPPQPFRVWCAQVSLDGHVEEWSYLDTRVPATIRPGLNTWHGRVRVYPFCANAYSAASQEEASAKAEKAVAEFLEHVGGLENVRWDSNEIPWVEDERQVLLPVKGQEEDE